MSYFSNASARQFGQLAACFLASKGRLSGAVDHAEIGRADADVRRALKSIGLVSEVFGTEFYQNEARAFLATMRSFSAFDQLAAMAQQVPVRRRIATLVAEIEAEGPGEAVAKAIAGIDIDDGQLALLKAVVLLVQSAEMVGALTETGVDFLLDQLRSALGPATDRQLFATILAGLSATPATGTDASAFRSDIAAALMTLDLSQTSRPAIVVTPDQAALLGCMENADGSTAFPDASWQGGMACGLPVFPSAGIPLDGSSSPGPPQVVVVDARGLALDPGTIELSPAEHATVIIDGDTTSLWQENLLGLRAERFVGAALARDGAVALIAGQYGSTGMTSP